MGMSYFYDGEFCFSRTISEAEAEEVLDVLRFEPDVVYEVECNTLRLITSGEAYSGRNEELRDLEEWCKKRGLHLVEGSYLHYTGDSDGAYYLENGKMTDHELKDYILWGTPTEELIEELKRRGIWQKQQRLIEIGRNILYWELDTAEYPPTREILDRFDVTAEDLEAFNLSEYKELLEETQEEDEEYD